MKLSSSSSSSNKPISSPSRVEKFPPPLMRFLRSNGGSRSRSGRRSSRLSSKSSPMFVIRKKNASSSTGIETTQTTHEPSSPKVSCMGQVHVHHQRSSKSKSKQNPSIEIPKCSSCSCSWIHEALFCKGLKLKFPGWRRKCCLFFQFGYGRKDENIEESVKTESRRQFTESYEENPREEDEVEEEEEKVEEEEKEERVFTSSSSSSSSSTAPPSSTIPPKNALLLMRCRSDPCRNRFSGGFSSVIEEKPELSNNIEEDEEIPTSEKEPIFIDSASESRIDLEEKMGFCEDFENLSNGRKRGNIRNGALMKVNGGFSSSSSSTRSLPLTLARCKSESETGYWNKRKNSGFDEKCPPLLL